MSQFHVMQAYRSVVDDVIEHVRLDFQEEGIEESTLVELQALWETKLMQSGALGESVGMTKREPRTDGSEGEGTLRGTRLDGDAGMMREPKDSVQSMKVTGKREAEETLGRPGGAKSARSESRSADVRDNENQDSEDEESLTSSEEEAEPETNNLVLSQFDRVHRSKNKWKCNLREGVMNIMGRDFLFSTGTGDFEWS